jgi:hypothetical protein
MRAFKSHWGGTHAGRQQGDITLFLFFLNKESSILTVLHARNRAHTQTWTRSNSMEQCPWETYGHSAVKETDYLLRNPKVYYRFHKRLPLNPVYTFILHYFMIHFNNIIPFATKSPKLSLSVDYPTKILPSSAGLFDKVTVKPFWKSRWTALRGCKLRCRLQRRITYHWGAVRS